MKRQIKTGYNKAMAEIQTSNAVDKFFRKYSIASVVCLIVMCFATVAFAATTPSSGLNAAGGAVDVGKNMIFSVYLAIVTISTVSAAVGIGIAALMMFYSPDQRSVDSSKAWIKRIIIAWIIINGAGLLFTTLTSMFGQYNLTI